MRVTIGPVFAEFGGPKDQRNVIDARNIGESNCRITVGLLAESFDTALSFYVHVTEYMLGKTKSNIVELRGRNVKRASAELECKVLESRPELVATKTVIYRCLPVKSVSRLFNVAWLATNLRIFGSQRDSLSYEDVVADSEQNALPEGVDFAIEKKSVGISDFMSIRCNSLHFADLVLLLRESTAGLKHELVETRLDSSSQLRSPGKSMGRSRG